MNGVFSVKWNSFEFANFKSYIGYECSNLNCNCGNNLGSTIYLNLTNIINGKIEKMETKQM